MHNIERTGLFPRKPVETSFLQNRPFSFPRMSNYGSIIFEVATFGGLLILSDFTNNR